VSPPILYRSGIEP